MRLDLSFTPNFTPKTIGEFIKQKDELTSFKPVNLEYFHILKKSGFDSHEECLKPENKEKNRYDDILCLDVTRVKITPKKGKNDYIHANYVDCYDIPKKYVVTQGPLKETVDQFWQLVWEQNSRIIVALTDLQVAGKEMCAPYWYPYNEQQIFQADELSIKAASETRYSGYLQTTFEVYNSDTKERRVIRHFMYSDWPNDGVPSNVESFMGFMGDVYEAQQSFIIKKVVESAPIIVHCTAGAGRSGTYCAIDSCIRELMKNETVSIPEAVLKVRHQRYASVLNERQYAFIYDVIYKVVKFYEEHNFHAYKNRSRAS